MPFVDFTPNQFCVHVFLFPSKRAREPQPKNYITYILHQGEGHKRDHMFRQFLYPGLTS